MKTIPTALGALITVGLLAASGCSTGKSGQEIAATGPTIVDYKATPGTVELKGNLQPTAPAEIFADVKDFHANVTDVKVRFVHVPLEIPMKRLAGSTWHAVLTPDQLRKLAVTGQTMKYDANIIAMNDNGETSTSRSPLQIAIKTPEANQLTAGKG
jgi:hypothetical protein